MNLVLEGNSATGGILRGSTGASDAFSHLANRATFWHLPRTSTSRRWQVEVRPAREDHRGAHRDRVDQQLQPH
jgi:hypothetical protein